MKNKKIFLMLSCIFVESIATVCALNAEPYLFTTYPQLKTVIPHIPLCDLPTSIIKLNHFGEHIGCKNVYMKRDDLSGKKTDRTDTDNGFRLYGSNKPRKLEFLLADALQHNAQTIITYGCAGSNHALATAVYAHELHLTPILMLKNQPNSYVVRHNLLLDAHYGAQLQFFPDNATRDVAADELLKNDTSAYRIPTGGSNAIGALGFVNAGLELAEQIKAGEITEPDFIYVASGSCGTAAGLLLGIQVAHLKSKLVAVCVEPEETKDEFLVKIKELFIQTNKKLHAADESFPLVEFPAEDLLLNKKFCGTQYGLYTPEAALAMKLFASLEDIQLEGTYSAKPIAAIMDDALHGYAMSEKTEHDGATLSNPTHENASHENATRGGEVYSDIRDKTILFWNTYCGIDFSPLIDGADYKKLPKNFHTYFEEDVQPLAR
jgi:D-cysteine desulfhydrase